MMDEQEYGILVKAPSWEPIERGLEIQESWKPGNLEVWRLGGLEARKTKGLGGLKDVPEHLTQNFGSQEIEIWKSRRAGS